MVASSTACSLQEFSASLSKLLIAEILTELQAPKQTQLRSGATQKVRKPAKQSAPSSQDAPKRGRLELTSSQEEPKKGGLTVAPTQTSNSTKQELQFPAKKNPRPAGERRLFKHCAAGQSLTKIINEVKNLQNRSCGARSMRQKQKQTSLCTRKG